MREAATIASYDVDAVRAEFPILAQDIRGKPLAYLDNAASTQKPRAVVERLRDFYYREYSNIHRGVHQLSQVATEAYEGAREKLRGFVNAREAAEIVFVRGATEAINLVAGSYGRANIGPGDEVVVTHMEHHSNIVPWQLLCEETGAELKVLPMTPEGELVLDELELLLSERTKLLGVVQVSNALGTVNPVAELVRKAHSHNVPVLVDGAQAVPHMAVDVQALDCDFYVLSGHKMYGPTGVGALYGKKHLLDAMPPYQGGGDMIRSVSFSGTEFAPVPTKLEAGTPNIADTVALGAAADFLSGLGLDAIAAHEQELLRYATERVAEVPGLRVIGTAPEKAGVLSFVLEGVHPHDIGTFMDMEGIAIRAGHHCAQPVMERLGIPATARVSFGLYNTREEVDRVIPVLHRIMEMFG